MATDKDLKGRPNGQATFRRTRFLASVLLSAPMVVFVYSPLLVALTVAGIAVPFATGRFIDALIGGTPPVAPFAALAALLLAQAIATPCFQRLVLSCARRIELKLQFQTLSAVMELSPDRLSALANGDIVAKLTRDAYAVGGFVSGLYPRLLAAVVTMASAGIALHARAETLSIAFVAFMPITIALFLPFAKRFAANSHAVRKRSDESFSALFTFFFTLPFLQTLHAGARFADEPQASLAALKDGNGRMDGLTVAFGALLGAILVGGEVAVLGIAGTLAVQGTIPVGDVVVYQMLFLAAMQSVQGIVSLLPETATLREGIDSLDEIRSLRPPRHGGRKIGKIADIEFRHVTFAYPGAAGKPVVRDFSATFRTGRIVALSGDNGAGKTTLLKLATGALKPQSGDVLVNGVPFESIDADDFREQLGIVFQDSLLFSGTIRDNITLRDPAFTETDIKAALASSGLDDLVERLPDGLETRVGLRGQSLSGGEKQRLAIARALIRKPGLLVLDEATNHLDAAARAAFGTRLRRLAAGRIVLLVSHDPALVELGDEKIVCQISDKPSYMSV
ncbi:MAG: ABC transporter ATP-binding protein [Kiritimatiellia bacterium]